MRNTEDHTSYVDRLSPQWRAWRNVAVASLSQIYRPSLRWVRSDSELMINIDGRLPKTFAFTLTRELVGIVHWEFSANTVIRIRTTVFAVLDLEIAPQEAHHPVTVVKCLFDDLRREWVGRMSERSATVLHREYLEMLANLDIPAHVIPDIYPKDETR
jgi:hypothetical protein